jgi:hypothetical protein
MYIYIYVYIYLCIYTHICIGAYVSKLLSTMGSNIVQPFNQYLTSNPELSHTTTDYLRNVYNDFLPKYREVEVTVGGSPLIKGMCYIHLYMYVTMYMYMHVRIYVYLYVQNIHVRMLRLP